MSGWQIGELAMTAISSLTQIGLSAYQASREDAAQLLLRMENLFLESAAAMARLRTSADGDDLKTQQAIENARKRLSGQ